MPPMNVHDTVFQYENKPTPDNLAAIFSHPDCILQFPDGEVMDHEVLKGGPQYVLDYLQDRFIRQTGDEKAFIFIRDAKLPNYRPQAMEITEDGVGKFHIVADGKDLVQNYLPKSLQEPKEPKKPSFGAKVKEFFSFFTGGSKTVREYDKYKEAMRTLESRRYDYQAKLGLNEVMKPDGYVRTSKKETNRTTDFTEYLVDRSNAAIRKTAERTNRSEKLRQTIQKNPEIWNSKLAAAVWDNLDSTVVKEQLGDKTLKLLTELTKEDFDQLETMLNKQKVPEAHIPDVLAAAEKTVGEEPTKGELLKAVHEKILTYQKKDYTDVSAARANEKTKAMNGIQLKQMSKLGQRLETVNRDGKAYQALSKFVSAGKPKDMAPAVLTLLTEVDEKTFKKLTDAFDHSKVPTEEIVGFLNRNAAPKGMMFQSSSMVYAVETAFRNYQPNLTEKKPDDGMTKK